MLEELATLAMALARAAAEKAQQHLENPMQGKDPVQTFTRLSQTIRQTIALEARIAAPPRQPGHPRAPTNGTTTRPQPTRLTNDPHEPFAEAVEVEVLAPSPLPPGEPVANSDIVVTRLVPVTRARPFQQAKPLTDNDLPIVGQRSMNGDDGQIKLAQDSKWRAQQSPRNEPGVGFLETPSPRSRDPTEPKWQPQPRQAGPRTRRNQRRPSWPDVPRPQTPARLKQPRQA